MRYLTAIIAMLPVAARAPAATTAPARWGEPQQGLAVSITVEGEPAVGGRLVLRCALRNNDAQSIRTDRAFGWLLIVQSREKAIFSDKVELSQVAGWPRQLESGKTAELEIDLSARSAFALQTGLKVIDGYPSAGANADAPKSIGKLADVLPVGPVRMRWTLVLPIQKPVLALASNALETEVSASAAKLSPEQRKALAADLIRQFDRSAFGAKAAHDRSIKYGAAILPDLLEAAKRPDAPDYSKMWIVTTIIDVGDSSAVDTLLELLKTADASSRNVIAYHGPKMRNAKLDAAITSQAQSGKDPIFTAWAARGMAAHSSTFPEKMLDIALSSDEPRARAEAAEVLVRKPEGRNLDRLLALLKDKHEMVRASAARAIAGAQLKSAKVIGAMVDSLDQPGDAARQVTCAALVKLTGQNWPYDPAADNSQKQRTITQWKQWWAGAEAQHE